MPRSSSRTSAIVFAGGRATRLGGTNKALLAIGGRPIIDRTLEALGPLVDEWLALTNDVALADRRTLRLVPDLDPHAGVLPALAGGLHAASAELCLVVAGDLPFVSRQVFERLLAIQAERWADAVIPRVQQQLQPMHAVYRRAEVLVAVEHALAEGQRRMTSFFPLVRVVEVPPAELRAVDPDLRSFLNVNTPRDLVEAERLAHAG